jgi:hypothetical protein
MIVGFNTDIKHRGKVYHCQTEDKGKDNPLVETLLYTKGQIHEALQTRYDHLLGDGYDEKKVLQLMEAQHKRGIELIKSDKYLSPEERAQAEKERAAKERAIGAMREDERSLDELVADWVNNEMEHEQVELIMSLDSELVAGSPVELRLKASKNISRALVANAKIAIKFISTVSDPKVVFEGVTDRMGECVARFSLPAIAEGNAAIIVRADSDLGTSELRQLVKRSA